MERFVVGRGHVLAINLSGRGEIFMYDVQS